MSNFVAQAEAAEAQGDWARAKMFWYYAAGALQGNPNGLRTEYNRREDRAMEKLAESLR